MVQRYNIEVFCRYVLDSAAVGVSVHQGGSGIHEQWHYHGEALDVWPRTFLIDYSTVWSAVAHLVRYHPQAAPTPALGFMLETCAAMRLYCTLRRAQPEASRWRGSLKA